MVNRPVPRQLQLCVLSLLLAFVSLALINIPFVQGYTTEDELTFVVTENSDAIDINIGDGICDTNASLEGQQCTLRAAIQESNAHPDKNLILLPADTLTLTIPGNQEDNAITGDLDIREAVEIRGAGIDQSIIDGGVLDRIFDLHAGSVPTSTVEMSGFTARNGQADAHLPFDGKASCSLIPDCGGVIRVDSHLILTDVATILSGAYRGGGIAVLQAGTLAMSGGRAAENYGSEGGGIYSEGQVRLNSVKLSSNQSKLGGGLAVARAGSAQVENSNIQYNHAEEGGGYAISGIQASLVMTKGGVLSNEATGNGGGVFATGQTFFNQVLFDYNKAAQSGGAIYGVTQLVGESSGVVTVNDSLFEFNEAERGGGIALNGLSLMLSGSTFNKNIGSVRQCGGLSITTTLPSTAVALAFNSTIVANSGGICHAEMAVDFTHMTVANNLTTGIDLQGNSPANFVLRNSVVANNQNADCQMSSTQATLPWQRTHVQHPGNCTFAGQEVTVNSDAQLGELGENGGNTPTLLPLPGSPLIDRIQDSSLCEAFDQRGIQRPKDGDGDGTAACDLGAVEYQLVITADHSIYLPLILKPRSDAWRLLGDNGQRLSTVAFDIQPTQGVTAYVGDTRPFASGGGLYSTPMPSDCKGMPAFQKVSSDYRVLDLLFDNQLAVGATFGNRAIFLDRANNVWLETPSSINTNVYALVQGSDGTVYAGSDDGVYKSTSGTEWEKIGGPPNINTLELRGNLLWIGTADDGIQLLNVLTNEMEKQINVGLQRSALEVWDILTVGDQFFIATSDGIYRRSGEDSYEASGLQGKVVNTLESDSKEIIAGLRNDGAWVSATGQTWQGLQSGEGWSATETVRKLQFNKDLCGGRVFAATDHGLWVLEPQ
ncbi:MAG: choice-of-anchor Q domain-containing protein [Caldilineaceae bacterium]